VTQSKKFRVALIGSESLAGKEIRDIFAARDFPLASFDFYDPDVAEEYSRLSQFRDEPKVVHHLEPKALEGVDLVFLAADPATNRTYGDLALKGAFRAIDLAGTSNERPEVAVVVAGVNDGVLRDRRPAFVANPHPLTVFVAHLLAAVRQDFGLERAVVFSLQPASAFGEEGIQELIDQSYGLLCGTTVAKKVFRDQAAFNLLARADKPGKDGFSAVEKQVRDEVRSVLGDPAFPFAMTNVQAPVFHTYSIMAYVETERPAAPGALENGFRSRAPFKVGTAASGPAVSSASVAGKDEIHIGLVKQDAASPRSAWVWLVADNLTAGSAVNAFAIARALCGLS
jgi:aspartate-semialdehyde dehydrogenase